MFCYFTRGMADSDFEKILADCAGQFSREELVNQRRTGYFPVAYVVADSNNSYLVRIPHFDKKETFVLYFYLLDDLKLKLRLNSIRTYAKTIRIAGLRSSSRRYRDSMPRLS